MQIILKGILFLAYDGCTRNPLLLCALHISLHHQQTHLAHTLLHPPIATTLVRSEQLAHNSHISMEYYLRIGAASTQKNAVKALVNTHFQVLQDLASPYVVDPILLLMHLPPPTPPPPPHVLKHLKQHQKKKKEEEHTYFFWLIFKTLKL